METSRTSQMHASHSSNIHLTAKSGKKSNRKGAESCLSVSFSCLFSKQDPWIPLHVRHYQINRNCYGMSDHCMTGQHNVLFVYFCYEATSIKNHFVQFCPPTPLLPQTLLEITLRKYVLVKHSQSQIFPQGLDRITHGGQGSGFTV